MAFELSKRDARSTRMNPVENGGQKRVKELLNVVVKASKLEKKEVLARRWALEMKSSEVALLFGHEKV